MQTLENGEWFAVGPAVLEGGKATRGIVRFQAGAVQTTHPEPGLSAPPPRKASSRQAQKLAGELAELAAKRADEPESLEAARATIKRLRGELGEAKEAREVAADVVKAMREDRDQVRAELVKRPAVDEGAVIAAVRRNDRRWNDEVMKPLRERLKDALGAASPTNREARGDVDAAVSSVESTPGVRPVEVSESAMRFDPPADPPRDAVGFEDAMRPGHAEARKGLAGPVRKILDSVAWWEQVGIVEPSVVQCGYIAGYAPKGGSFNTYLSRASSDGLIERGGGTVKLTEAGRALARTPKRACTMLALHDAIAERLDGPGRKLMFAITKMGDRAMTPSEIAEATGYAAGGGSFNTYLSRLSSLGLIDRSAGKVRPTAVLFPEGLR